MPPSYDPIAFESIGLSNEDVPTTWLEFLRLVARLPEILQEFADISAFDPNMNAQTARAFLLSSVLDAYWEVSAQPGNAQKLDTPLFRQLMEAFEAIDFAGLNATGTVGEATSAPFVEHRVLFPTLSGNRIAPAGNTEYALFLSLREGMEPVFLTHLTAAFVNPYSQNTQAAIAFLETAVNALDSEQRICLLPEENAPVPNPQYELNWRGSTGKSPPCKRNRPRRTKNACGWNKSLPPRASSASATHKKTSFPFRRRTSPHSARWVLTSCWPATALAWKVACPARSIPKSRSTRRANGIWSA